MQQRNVCAIVLAWGLVLGICAGSAFATKGDVNDDGAVNELDVGPFIDVLLGQNMDATAICNSDVSGNGEVNAGDIEHLVDSIINGASDLQISDNNAPCSGGPFRKLEDGDILNLCGGFQNATELHLRLRMTGFDPNATVDINYALSPLSPTACPCAFPYSCVDGECLFGGGTFFGVPSVDIGCGVNEFAGQIEILQGIFSFYDGQDAILSVTVTDSANPLISASETVLVTLDAFQPCFTQANCPPNHTCTNNYCYPN